VSPDSVVSLTNPGLIETGLTVRRSACSGGQHRQFSNATLALLTDQFHIDAKQPTEEATTRALVVRLLNATKLLA